MQNDLKRWEIIEIMLQFNKIIFLNCFLINKKLFDCFCSFFCDIFLMLFLFYFDFFFYPFISYLSDLFVHIIHRLFIPSYSLLSKFSHHFHREGRRKQSQERITLLLATMTSCCLCATVT